MRNLSPTKGWLNTCCSASHDQKVQVYVSRFSTQYHLKTRSFTSLSLLTTECQDTEDTICHLKGKLAKLSLGRCDSSLIYFSSFPSILALMLLSFCLFIFLSQLIFIFFFFFFICFCKAFCLFKFFTFLFVNFYLVILFGLLIFSIFFISFLSCLFSLSFFLYNFFLLSFSIFRYSYPLKFYLVNC